MLFFVLLLLLCYIKQSFLLIFLPFQSDESPQEIQGKIDEVNKKLNQTLHRLEELRGERDNVEKELRSMTENLSGDEPKLETVCFLFIHIVALLFCLFVFSSPAITKNQLEMDKESLVTQEKEINKQLQSVSKSKNQSTLSAKEKKRWDEVKGEMEEQEKLLAKERKTAAPLRKEIEGLGEERRGMG